MLKIKLINYTYNLEKNLKENLSFHPDLNEDVQEVEGQWQNHFIHKSVSTMFLGIYLNEKLNFCYHISVTNVHINARNRCH